MRYSRLFRQPIPLYNCSNKKGIREHACPSAVSSIAIAMFKIYSIGSKLLTSHDNNTNRATQAALDGRDVYMLSNATSANSFLARECRQLQIQSSQNAAIEVHIYIYTFTHVAIAKCFRMVNTSSSRNRSPSVVRSHRDRHCTLSCQGMPFYHAA